MSAIFLSYRRDDAAGHAGRLYDRLAARFGAERVFMDVDDIAPGEHFAQVIQRRIAGADVVLVVIGPHWLDLRDETGRRRLDDDEDFVRLEILTALAAGRRLVPVLVGGAELPGAPSLPAPLQPLTERQAVRLRDDMFDQDAAMLVAFVQGRIPDAGGATARHRKNAFAAAVALMVLGALGFWWRGGNTPEAVMREAGPPPPAVAQAAFDKFVGDWQAEVHYPWGVTMTETFRFTREGDGLAGSAGFLGVARPVLEARVEHGALLFTVRSEAVAGERRELLVHEYRAAHEVVSAGVRRGERLRVMMRTSRDGVADVPHSFVAERVELPARQ